MAEKCDGVGERTWNRFAGVVKSVPAVDAIPVVTGDFEQCSTCKVGRKGDGMKDALIGIVIGLIIIVSGYSLANLKDIADELEKIRKDIEDKKVKE